MLISMHFSVLGTRSPAADPMAHAVSMAARVESTFGRPPHFVVDRSGVLRLHVHHDAAHALTSVASVRSDAAALGFQLVAVVMTGPPDDGAIGAVYAAAPAEALADL